MKLKDTFKKFWWEIILGVILITLVMVKIMSILDGLNVGLAIRGFVFFIGQISLMIGYAYLIIFIEKKIKNKKV